ncbi:MAG: carbohydrate ABC transporter permease [Spirochaetales bacterium]|nr:carbohydrate ABC transporter permease [Spirochaetales bacterium]
MSVRLSVSKAISKVAVHLVLAVMMLIFLYPVIWLLQFSLKPHVEAFKVPIDWTFVPNFVHYRNLLFEGVFLGRLLNSFIASGTATVLSIAVGAPAAYALSRLRARGKNLILLTVLTSRMAPPIAFIVPYFLIYIQLGLTDRLVGLILIYTAFSLGLVVWSLWAFFDAVPKELDQQAQIDGASTMQILLKIILPVAVAGLASTGVLCFVLAWNDFIFALILTRTRAVTAPVEITKAMAYQAEELGMVAAGAIIVATPAIIFSIIVRKYLRSGMLGGALKG